MKSRIRSKKKGVKTTGIIKDFLNFRKFKYAPFYVTRGEYQANGSLYESDIVGAIANCIATNAGKLKPQLVRNDKNGLTIKNDYLAKILSVRWAPEYTPFDALYKMASDLVYKSNAFAVIFWDKDFLKVTAIRPITTRSHRIWEDDDGNILFQFVWDYDGKTYTIPYAHVIHIKARLNKNRFLGSAPDHQLQSTLELLDTTNEGLRNIVKNSANLKGYLKYNNLIDADE